MCAAGDPPAVETPVAYTVGRPRQQPCIVATANNRGEVRWVMADEAFNSDKRVGFLQALVKDAGQPCF